MTGIGVATATAGIVAGTIALTDPGLMMTEFVEFVSGGNVFVVLIMVAEISLVLVLGIPTTGNCILISSLTSQPDMSVPRRRLRPHGARIRQLA
ncbi:hypothetical protein RM190_19810 [Paracoccus sp. CPCC 101403]|uniref:TRAP transporter large permease subunit n=1 Tax=Paracoccus broussonetiae TaxID=3075834 RepID=A0ABU3EIQ2_9RHOB|nr:hypothetical protein [Paracoccus sp. CPCC 101403]MDT1064118.1 hypothetical protein [Paracoccus sp. CPCC 101403]